MAIRRVRQDDLENQLNRGALWAVTYGDLMSYLMIFFLIMFSFGMAKSSGGSSKERRKYHASLVSIQKVFGGKGSSVEHEREMLREKEETMVARVQEAVDKKKLSK